MARRRNIKRARAWHSKLLCFALFGCAAGAALAQDDFFSDINTAQETNTEEKRLQFKGFYQQHIKYGLGSPDPQFAFERQKSGLSMLRSDLFIEFERKLGFDLNVRLSTKAEVEAYRWSNNEGSWESHNERLLLRDAFVDLTVFKDHWLRLGHQLFSWGDSESLAILDVLSLRDQREFAQAQLRDLREQVPALLYSVPTFNGKLNFVATYHAGHNRYADEDDEFYPYIRLKNTGLRLRRQDVDNEFEYALKYDRQFNGGDLSILIADVNNNDFSLAPSSTSNQELALTQERVGIAGLSANRVFGSLLLRGEIAHRFNQPVSYGNGFYETDQTRGALGLEYSGINDWIFSYEINYLENRSTPEELGLSGDTQPLDAKPGHTVNIRHTALNDRFQQNFWYFKFIDDQGKVYRWDINYDWSDTLEFGLTTIFYDVDRQSSVFFPFRNHDSVNLSIKVHF